MTSTTAAYRNDLAAHGRPFGEHDGDWIVAGTLCERAASAHGSDVERLLLEAAGVAAASLGEAELTRLASWEWGTGYAGLDPIALLAISELSAGAKHVAAALLDAALAQLRGADTLLVGRMLACRARAALQLDERDLAADFYGQVERLAKKLGSIELQVRAVSGEAALRQFAGNLSGYRAAARRRYALAQQTGIESLHRDAHYGMMVSAAFFKEFEDAHQHSWQVVRLSQRDPLEQASALQSLGQLLLEMGDHTSARAAFAAVTQYEARPTVHLAALGGLAIAAAITKDEAMVDWCVGEIMTFRGKPIPLAAFALALIEAATALGDIGRFEEAQHLQGEALAIATVRGYHALAYRAEMLDLQTPPAVVSAPVDRTTRDILESVRRLEPERLPPHVRVYAGV
jgi:tetratricopeptide (TPR) repeat protein